MGGQLATLGGRPLAGTVSWGLGSGCRPYQTTVMLTLDSAARLFGAQPTSATGPTTPGGTSGGTAPAKPVDLVLGADTFHGIYVLNRSPAINPKVAMVLISDRRWLWSMCHYKRAFNITRKMGTKRLTAPNQITNETSQLDVLLTYRAWSLKNKTEIWTAADLLNDLATAIKEWERNAVGVEPEVIIPNLANMGAEQVPIQNLELDGTLEECIERALAYLPGMDVYVRPDGAVEFFWRTDRSEMDVVKKLGPEVQNQGHIEWIDYSRVRPSKIRVYFDIEAELKFLANEVADSHATSDRTPGSEDLFCENVLPIPDYSLVVDGKTMTTGTYITFAEAFRAWGTPTFGKRPLDFPFVRMAFVPFNNLWNAFQMIGDPQADADWSARIGAIQSNYRQTFRINKNWVDRFSDLRAYRVATINTATGTRGASPVFSDFCYVPSMRSWKAELSNNGQIGYVVNVAFFPISGEITETTRACPAELTLIDAEQGIFRVDYQADKFGLYQASLPSQIELQGANTRPGHPVNATQAGPGSCIERRFGAYARPLAFDCLGPGQSPSQLTAEHALATILTAVPGSPNSKRSLCYVDVLPSEVDLDFPGKDRCLGPIQEIRIGASIETARMGFTEQHATRIKSIFTTDDTSEIGPNEAYPHKDLVLNYYGNVAGGSSLTAVARAEALRHWFALRDRAVGSATFGYHGDAKMQGSISAVEHTLSSSGAMTTRVDLPGRIAPLAIERYLPSSILRIWRKIIQPGK